MRDTYGLARPRHVISRTWESIWEVELEWRRSYGDLWLASEKAQCSYNFRGLRTPNGLQQLFFALYEAEASDLAAAGLPAPGPPITCSVRSHTSPASRPVALIW